MSSSAERRLRRANWPVRVHRLGDEPVDAHELQLSAEERLKAVWELTVEAWALAGKEIPSLERSEMPVRIIPIEKHEDS